MKYRKKPHVIEAWPFRGCVLTIASKFPGIQIQAKNNSECYIETLEGKMRVNIGDYIVKGIKGEFYPVRSDIFVDSYELVEAL